MSPSDGLSPDHRSWSAENVRRLQRAATRLHGALEARIAGLEAAFAAEPEVPLALEHLAGRFCLTDGERDLLLLCYLVERRATLADLAGRLRGDSGRTHAAWDLADQLLARVVDPLWLSPSAALRRWRLLDLSAGQPLARATLSLDERVSFFIEGHSFLDARLEGLIRPLRAAATPSNGTAPFVGVLRGAASPVQLPVVEVTGADAAARSGLIAAGCRQLGLQPYALRTGDIPAPPGESEALARLWEREAMLLDAALVVEREGAATGGHGRLETFLEGLEAIVFVSGEPQVGGLRRPVFRCRAPDREIADEIGRWRAALGPLATRLNGSVERTASQFRLDEAGLQLVAAAAGGAETVEEAAEVLWDSARQQSRRQMSPLAERVEQQAEWEDLVLPEPQLQVLRNVALHVRERHRVYDQWGFATKGPHGLGIAALFSGSSGTGKTLAASVLAGALKLDLYRVDLARIVSKYIGETEKNLARVFEEAEAGGAIVLFDEADALFGKRSEVRDSHDRYANIEVSYLLQRIESYRGLAILTTNLKPALDSAFMRRIRFVVHFPFPDSSARRQIWSRVFPSALPRQSLDLEKLARLNVTGGHIRNIAVNAAFLAAGDDRPLGMAHLRAAAEAEYAKLERPAARRELDDWA